MLHDLKRYETNVEKTILALGSSGAEVFSLQHALRELGYVIEVTGFYDGITADAVAHLQQAEFCTGGVTAPFLQHIYKKAEDQNSQEGTMDEWDQYTFTANNTGRTYNTGAFHSLPCHEANYHSRHGWTPETILIGYTGTAGQENTATALNYPGGLSAHFVIWDAMIGRFVDIAKSVSCIPTKDPLTVYKNIVILLEGFGPLQKVETAEYQFHHIHSKEVVYDATEYGLPLEFPDEPYGYRYWMPFTPSQLASLKALCHLLVKKYPTISNIQGINEVSALAGVMSPGPGIDLAQLRLEILNKES